MSWGTKLIIALISFMGFIVFLGIRMVFSNEDALIDKDYYEQGINYDTEYNEKQQALQDSIVPQVTIKESGLNIAFPVPVKYKIICKKLSDANKDRSYNSNTESRNIQLNAGELEKGAWLLAIEYRVQQKKYFVKRQIVLP